MASMLLKRAVVCRTANRIFHVHQPLFVGLQHRHVSFSKAPISGQELFEQNRKRSQGHREEIIHNKEPNDVSHPHANIKPEFEDYGLPHIIWTKEQMEAITPTHKKPVRTVDKLAYASVGMIRFVWDMSTGYTLGRQLGLFKFTPNMWLLRIVFLETVAGVPGMMFGMVRHLNSLRRMERDHGWIKMLLAEAENERMHLLTAINLYEPSKPMRYLIVIAQGIMCNALFAAYLISPRFCHSWVGYIEEQAVHTYTAFLQDIDDGKYPEFEKNASSLAKAYWKLPFDATWRDVFANIRADESHHRDVNHDLAELTDDPNAENPYRGMERNDVDYNKITQKIIDNWPGLKSNPHIVMEWALMVADHEATIEEMPERIKERIEAQQKKMAKV